MPPASTHSRARLAFVLGALAMFGPFSIDTVFPAFTAMKAALGTGDAGIQQSISVYLVAYAAMSLFHGPISDAVGRRRVILVGTVVFTAASIGCALATDLTTLLVFRALQGLSAGVGLIVGRAIIRDAFDGDDAQRLMSQVSMIFGIAPAIAPIIGGWIMGLADWHAIFWFLAVFGALLWLLAATLLPETHPVAARTPLRVGTLWGTNVAMLRNRAFRRLALAGTFNFGALFVYIAAAHYVVERLLGLAPDQYGWFFVPTIGGMILGAFVSGRMAGRIGGARMANLGFACCLAAVLGNVGYHALVDAPTAFWTIAPMSLLAFGIALVFPILTLAVLDMYPRQRGAASSLQAFIGLSSNALIAGLLVPLVARGGLVLAIAAACFTLAGFATWRLYRRGCHADVAASREAAALEPTERL